MTTIGGQASWESQWGASFEEDPSLAKKLSRKSSSQGTKQKNEVFGKDKPVELEQTNLGVDHMTLVVEVEDLQRKDNDGIRVIDTEEYTKKHKSCVLKPNSNPSGLTGIGKNQMRASALYSPIVAQCVKLRGIQVRLGH